MTTAAELGALERACMADLGRLRQEELPLSNEQRRGPSFIPTTNNAARHIPTAYKKNLESKWSVAIRDEESEQMDGLDIGDARPWAKTGKTTTRVKPNLQPITARKPSGPPPPASQAKPSTRPVPTGIAPPRPNPLSVKVEASKSPEPSNAQSTTVNSTSVTAKRIFTVDEGSCQLPLANWFIAAKYEMNLDEEKQECSFVILVPEKGKNIHEVSALREPTVQEENCIVTTADGKIEYRLKLDGEDRAKKVQRNLRALQQITAKRYKSQQQNSQVRDASGSKTEAVEPLLVTPSPHEMLSKTKGGKEMSVDKPAPVVDRKEVMLSQQPSPSVSALPRNPMARPKVPIRYTLEDIESLNPGSKDRNTLIKNCGPQSRIISPSAATSETANAKKHTVVERKKTPAAKVRKMPAVEAKETPIVKPAKPVSLPLASLNWEALVAGATQKADLGPEPMDIGEKDQPGLSIPHFVDHRDGVDAWSIASPVAEPSPVSSMVKQAKPMAKSSRPGLKTSRWAS